jgi:predicted site-specific integrase-resolvase
VSSSKQKDDLERQVQAMQEEFPGYRVYTDVASGLNYKRKGLTRLLEHVQEGLVGEVVVAHPDRLARFGRELIEWIISRAGARLIFQDQIVDRPRGSEAELAADLLAVVHVFSCRANGQRRYKRAKQGGSAGAKQCILEPEPGREKVQEIGTGCSTRSADDAVSTGTPPTYTSSTSMANTMAHGF